VGFALVGDLVTYRSGITVPTTTGINFASWISRNSTSPTGTPISLATFEQIKKAKVDQIPEFDLYVGGSFYPERHSFYQSVLDSLQNSSMRVRIKPKVSDDYVEYLADLSKSKMVLATNFHRIRGKDRFHLLGKSLETLHVGSLLLAQSVPELTSNFKEYKHFVPIQNPKDAVDKINYYFANEDERASIAASGYAKAREYAESKNFLSQIAFTLEASGLPEIRGAVT
jgi:hypothetical protein